MQFEVVIDIKAIAQDKKSAQSHSVNLGLLSNTELANLLDAIDTHNTNNRRVELATPSQLVELK